MNREIPITLPSRVKFPREPPGGGRLASFIYAKILPSPLPPHLRATQGLSVGGSGRYTGMIRHGDLPGLQWHVAV